MLLATIPFDIASSEACFTKLLKLIVPTLIVIVLIIAIVLVLVILLVRTTHDVLELVEPVLFCTNTNTISKPILLVNQHY